MGKSYDTISTFISYYFSCEQNFPKICELMFIQTKNINHMK